MPDRDLKRELRRARQQLHDTSGGYTLEELMRVRKRELVRLNVLRARLGVWKEHRNNSYMRIH